MRESFEKNESKSQVSDEDSEDSRVLASDLNFSKPKRGRRRNVDIEKVV